MDEGTAPRPASELPTPWLLRRASQRYRDDLRRAIARAGHRDLPQQGFWALDRLASGGCDAVQLALDLGITKQAVSRLVEQLVAAGYVERRPNSADRRRVSLALTAKGDRAAGVLRSATDETDRSVIDRLGNRGLDQLRGLLAKVADGQPVPIEER
jgi:DNA-binding MarR family transcriptional regulator